MVPSEDRRMLESKSPASPIIQRFFLEIGQRSQSQSEPIERSSDNQTNVRMYLLALAQRGSRCRTFAVQHTAQE